jgi:hypothetical protein
MITYFDVLVISYMGLTVSFIIVGGFSIINYLTSFIF